MTATTHKLINGYEVVIGFETHTQLAAQSKIFSRASTAFGAEPNTQACPVDLALPGTLPVMNKQAVECAIKLGLALGSTIAPVSIFARKNYFYPDLPKGYQISQFEIPVVQGGEVSFFLEEGKETVRKTVRLVRAHLEEDAGKSVHDEFIGQSGIDLNRAGTPLLEIVTEPDMRGTAEAVAYAKKLHQLVTWIRICDGNMQEGSFRCDANVSVRKPGQPLGTRREIKNLNSFKNMQIAIDYEIRWQIEQIEDGYEIQQATVLFNPDTGETRAMRTKEDAADYRYFPDPDLPPLIVASEWVEQVKSEMPELPDAMAARFVEQYGLSETDAANLIQSQEMAAYFEGTAKACGQPKLASNWIMGEVSRRINESEISFAEVTVPAEALGEIISRVKNGKMNAKGGKEIFDSLWEGKLTFENGKFYADSTFIAAGVAQTSFAPLTIDALIDVMGLTQMSDTGALEAIIDEVIAANPGNVEQYRAGKDKAFNALVGQVMKASKGKANPGQVNEVLKAKLA